MSTDTTAQYRPQPLTATAETREALVADAAKIFAQWHAKPYLAPELILDLVRAEYPRALRDGDWTVTVTQSPTDWRVTGNLCPVHRRRCRARLPRRDAAHVRLDGGSAPWVMDNQSWTPRLVSTKVTVQLA